MSFRTLPLLILAGIAGPALAGGTIQSGTTYLSFTGTPFSGTSGDANLLFGGTGAFGTDMLYKFGWAYNQGNFTSNRTFSGLGGPVESYAGNIATFTWTNAGAGAAGFARWDAVMTVKLTQVMPTPGTNQPGMAYVDTKLSFTSSAANVGNVNFSVFGLQDFDILGTNVNAGPGDTYTVVDASAATGIKTQALDPTKSYYVESWGLAANRYEFNTGSNLRSKLGFDSDQTAPLSNLNTLAGVTAANLVNADGAVAYQWTQSLAPGQTMDIHTVFAINTPVPEASTYGMMMAGLLAVGAIVRRRRRGG